MPSALADCFRGHYQGPWPLKQLPRLAVRSRSLQQEWPPGPTQDKHGSSPIARQAGSAMQPAGPGPSLRPPLTFSPSRQPTHFLFHPQLLPLLRRGTHIAKSRLGPTSCKQHSLPPGDEHPEDPSTHHGKRPTDTPGSRATWAGGVLGTCRLDWKPGHDPCSQAPLPIVDSH